MDILLTPEQQETLSATMVREKQLEDQLTYARQITQGMILMLTGTSGAYRLVTDQGPWRIISNEVVEDSVASAGIVQELGAAPVDSD